MEGACGFVEAMCDRVPTDSPLEKARAGRQADEKEKYVAWDVVSCLTVGELTISLTGFWAAHE
jgi:hypothetical protein